MALELRFGSSDTLSARIAKSQREAWSMADQRLRGKVIIVAGGATGIGAATALKLSQAGAAVVIGDVNLEGAEKVIAQINGGGGQARAMHCDISDDRSVAALIKSTVDWYGALDGIHINAADLSIIGEDGDALSVPMEIFDRTIAVDLRGHLLCTRHALPVLLKRGGGALVYTSSDAAFMGEPIRLAYGVAKAGINALMRHVASRWGKQGIRANSIAPGFVLTETATASIGEEERKLLGEATRSRRLGKPEDIAGAVVFLMSDEGEWINGQTISVNGGILLR
jgi:NAD(P)-dependent dehydrogenase (short-subunit alcohol dehydrogenase family)